MIDIIIVGAGLYGAVVARRACEHGLRVLVIERRKHIGGNCRDEWMDGICVHQYGAHIFHTNNADIWRFVNRFANFTPYYHMVLAHNGGKFFHLPFSLQTFHEVYGITSPQEIEMILHKERKCEYYPQPHNLEEQTINLVGRPIYELLIKGYTEKQWGRPTKELSPDIIRRLPVRSTWDTGYFSDSYQGIPKEGYTRMIEKMLEGIEVRTDTDFCRERGYWIGQASRIVYTGMVDELLDYCYGTLPYRSLRFENERIDIPLFQGAAVINETDVNVPYTRTIEHKHFLRSINTPYSIITREYPQEWKLGREAYYPVENKNSRLLYERYMEQLGAEYPTIEVGGRLGLFRYLDMDETIEIGLRQPTNMDYRINEKNSTIINYYPSSG